MATLLWQASWLLAVSATLAGCNAGEKWRTFCTSDSNCPAGYRCDNQSGLCLCASDTVCGPDEYCAPDGSCRRRMACDNNLDCPDGTLCDTATGNCIELAKCTSDVQCLFGQICSGTYFRCVVGCRVDGDCPLGQVCLGGQCQEGLCEDESFCAYGQLCDTSIHTCYDDTRGPYCQPCAYGTINDPYNCGPGPNFCLMTGNDPSLEPFCGVDCSDGQECPNGYFCDLILIAPEGSCQADEECPSKQCHINEGDTVGFCLCSLDQECPQDSCNDVTTECRITQKPCSPGQGDCDRPIFCIEGLCLVGRNCTPKEGLRCQDLKP